MGPVTTPIRLRIGLVIGVVLTQIVTIAFAVPLIHPTEQPVPSRPLKAGKPLVAEKIERHGAVSFVQPASGWWPTNEEACRAVNSRGSMILVGPRKWITSRDGRWMIVDAQRPDSLRRQLHLIDLKTGALIESLDSNVRPDLKRARWSPDGKNILFFDDRGRVILASFDRTPAHMALLSCEDPAWLDVESNAWAPDGGSLAFLVDASDAGAHTCFSRRFRLVHIALKDEPHVLEDREFYVPTTGSGWCGNARAPMQPELHWEGSTPVVTFRP